MWHLVKNETAYSWQIFQKGKFYYLSVSLVFIFLEMSSQINSVWSNPRQIIHIDFIIDALIFSFLKLIPWLYVGFIIHSMIMESMQKRLNFQSRLACGLSQIATARWLIPVVVYLLFLLIYYTNICIFVFRDYNRHLDNNWIEIASFILIFTFCLKSFTEKLSRILSVAVLGIILFGSALPTSISEHIFLYNAALQTFTSPMKAILSSFALAVLMYISYIRRKSYLR